MLFGACRGGFKAKATCCDTRMSAIHVRLGQFTIAGLLEKAAETWFELPTSRVFSLARAFVLVSRLVLSIVSIHYFWFVACAFLEMCPKTPEWGFRRVLSRCHSDNLRFRDWR